MASIGLDYTMKDVIIHNFTALTKSELVKALGASLLNTVGAAAGAAGSVFVLRGILGKDAIGRFEQLIGIIGGTVIGSSAGCIAFSFSGFVALGFVTAFIVGALAGGIICAITAYRKQIFSAIHNLVTTIMDKICGFTKAVVEAVGNAVTKVLSNMYKAYNTILATLERVKEAMKGMDREQKERVLKGVAATTKKAVAEVDQTVEVFQKEIEDHIAGTGAKALNSDVKKSINQTKDENSKAVYEALQDLESASITTP